MFTQKKKEYYSRILGFKDYKNFEDFSKRYLCYLEKIPLSKNRIMSGFFILVEIQKESFQNKSLINFDGIKNQYIRKYAHEILELRKKGMGSQSIAKNLYVNHRITVSRGTLEKFYKQNIQ